MVLIVAWLATATATATASTGAEQSESAKKRIPVTLLLPSVFLATALNYIADTPVCTHVVLCRHGERCTWQVARLCLALTRRTFHKMAKVQP